MEFYEREFFISRILVGKIKVGQFFVHTPTLDDLYYASERALEYRNKYKGLMFNNDEILEFLYSKGLWNEEQEQLAGDIQNWLMQKKGVICNVKVY